MRILQVITDTDRRGAQVFATDLGAAMAGRGHSIVTVALAPGTQRPGLDVEVLGSRQRGFGTLRALRRRMKAVDITVAHGSSTGLACALAGVGPGRPFVYRQISDTRFWASSWSRRLRVAVYLRQARSIVALSEGAEQDLVAHLRLPAWRITVVPNGVPIGSFHVPSPEERGAARELYGLPQAGFVALYIGALVPEKGVDVAIRAVAEVPGVTLAVVGGGPGRLELERLAAGGASGAGDVRFLGVVTDTFPAYAASDVVVLPSKGGDSMPATLIESAFCGLPAIATPIGSITDVVLDGETGIIVPPDDVAAFGAALGRLAAAPEIGRRLGQAAVAHGIAHFEIEVVADGWLRVLERRPLGVPQRLASER